MRGIVIRKKSHTKTSMDVKRHIVILCPDISYQQKRIKSWKLHVNALFEGIIDTHI